VPCRVDHVIRRQALTWPCSPGAVSTVSQRGASGLDCTLTRMRDVCGQEEGEQARIKEEALELARLRKKQEEEERATGLQWEVMSGRDEKRGESRGP